MVNRAGTKEIEYGTKEVRVSYGRLGGKSSDSASPGHSSSIDHAVKEKRLSV